MRIKWNRHLDGSSSRREDEGTPQEADDKKGASASSTPGIFKIFRRKKKRSGGGGDENKVDVGCFVVPQQPLPEAAEDDSASISSVATCASQPVTEGNFHRDRSASLFSSFRLSLPGSKRKKRKIAPTPSETILNGGGGQQQTEPQVDRYSTPDLRKPPPGNLDPNVAQVSSLSTSSPSIRANNNNNSSSSSKTAVPSSSAQSLDVANQNSDKLKWSKTSSSKLSKSVSFSDCCKDGDGGNGGLAVVVDSSHSAGDNKAPWAVNCEAMVEEECSGALESETAACLSDNLRMSRESQFTPVGDDFSKLSGLQKQRPAVTVAPSAVVMTKTERDACRSSKQNAIVGEILNGIATDIQSYGKVDGTRSAAGGGSLVTPSVNGDSSSYSNGHSNEAITADDEVPSLEENKRYELCAEPNQSQFPSVQCPADVSSCVSERNTDFQKECDDTFESISKLSHSETNDSHDKPDFVPLNSKLEALTSELSVLTTARNLSELSCDTIVNDAPSDVGVNSSAAKICEDSSFVKNSVIASDKHVMCRIKIYDNEPLVEKTYSSNLNSHESPTFDSPTNKKFQNLIHDDSALQKRAFLRVTERVNGDSLVSNDKSCFDKKFQSCIHDDSAFQKHSNSQSLTRDDTALQKHMFLAITERINGDTSVSTDKSCLDSQSPYSLSKSESPAIESSAFSSRSVNNTDCDQQVPECRVTLENHCSLQNDQQVPEFELSLREFEEVCSKYMSRSTPEFSGCDSSFPLYSNSPKPKSVLDLSYSFIYPDEESFPEKSESSVISSDLILQNIQLQSSCQSPTGVAKKYTLPSLPKQWDVNGKRHEKPTDYVQSSSDFRGDDGVQCKQWDDSSEHENPTDTAQSSNSRDGVQRTSDVRGKYLCQEPNPGALPTTAASAVMLGDSDTPQQLSTTLQSFESGRERVISNVTGEKQRELLTAGVPSSSPEDNAMLSNVGTSSLPTLNGILDRTFVVSSESPGKNGSSFFPGPEMKNVYRGGPRAICDPLIYGAELTTAAKGLESLGPENYLNGHNFSGVGFCEVISDNYGGKGLIEISNPYEENFILPQDLSNLVRVNLHKGEKVGFPSSDNVVEHVDRIHVSSGIVPKIEKSSSLSDVSEIYNVSSGKSVSNDIEQHAKENKLSSQVEQKNLKNKNSMIPCRKKATPNNENNKRIETKSKSKKSNSLPRFNKTESHLPVKNNSASHRVLSKDSGAEAQPPSRGKKKDLSVKCSNNKPNGNCSDTSSRKISDVNEFGFNFQHGSSLTDFNDRRCSTTTQSKTSGSSPETSCYTSDVIINLKENGHSSSFVVDLSKPVVVSQEKPHYSNGVTISLKNKQSTAFVVDLNEPTAVSEDEPEPKSFLSTSTDNIPSIAEFDAGECQIDSNTPLKCAEISDNTSECAASVSESNYYGFVHEVCPECMDVEDHLDIVSSNNVKHRYCSKHSDYTQQCSRRSSLSAVGMFKSSYTSSKESLNSQVTNSSNRGKSRIPRKQPGSRGVHPSTGKGPVRPPMWLSKAELTQEIQRLGTLCEARTKELNRLKMETKHVSVGFDAFAALFKYMVEDLNGLTVPALTEDLGKTLKQLELTKQDLAYYEREVEEMKSHHCQELNDLSNKLFEVYQSEVAELNAKHQEEINHLKSEHQNQIEHLKATFDASSAEAKAHHEKMIAGLEQEIINQREELQAFQEREIRDLEEKHAESSKLLQDHIEQLQKKCAELKQHSMSMEDAMRKDTDSKLQWVTTAKLDIEKEVESLKAVLEMKNKELHTLRIQNLEMEKQLEELPFAREKIKMLQARAEDLEALMVEKTKIERKLSSENQQMRETYEKESKVNRRLSMENEELQWRLRQAENSLISGSFSEVPEFPEAEENGVTSPTKSPPQILSRSVFFTFVDKDESSPRSPRTQYKKITPNFSANYKTSPAKSSKSPPAPSPRRGKSHSEPPQPPIAITSTPRKVAKQPFGKTKGPQKRQRSESDSTRPGEHAVAEVNFSSVTESMASSVSSESSVFEHRERLLEEHKEHIIHSLEILREQRSTEGSVDEPATASMDKKWCSDDIKVTGELSNLEREDMSRSAEFSDPKTYYHMTFPVLKESGITDCDIDDGCKNSSSGNSPVKEAVNPMHSMSENNIHRAVEASDNATLQVMSMSSHEVGSSAIVRIQNKRISCTESSLSAENVQNEAASDGKTENRWRTI